MPGARDAPSLPVKGIGWVFIPESPTENEMKSWHSHQRTVGPQKWQFVVTITGGGVESSRLALAEMSRGWKRVCWLH